MAKRRGLFRDLPASGSDDDVRALAELGIQRLLKDLAGLAAIVVVRVERRHRGARDAIVLYHAGGEAAFHRVLHHGLVDFAIPHIAFRIR